MMMKKFTEEQYEAIIDAWNSSLLYDRATHFVIEYVNSIGSCNYEAALAIANPKTRELSHDRYVEKEKLYVWQSKQETSDGKVKRLYDAAIGVSDSFIDKTEPTHNGNRIAESRIKEWGYNPEMFNKREV